MQKLPVVFIVIGVAVGILSLLVGLQLFPMLMKKKIGEQGKLVPGTPKYDSWKVVPIPVFQKIYIFNVTNPEEVKQGGKPSLVELGPYVYQQKRVKVDISIDEENDTISYRHLDSFFFREDMSKGSLSDKITVPNMPFLGAVYKSMLAGTAARYMLRTSLDELFPDEDMYINLTVDEFLFGGYYVPLLKELSELAGRTLLPNNTFGLYYGKNGTQSEKYEIYSGVKNPDKFGQVVSYAGKTSLGIFENYPECDKIVGRDGPTMAPFINEDKEFFLFVPNFCRSMKFTCESNITLDGVNALKFTVPEVHLADVRSNPDNECYCSSATKNYDNCLKGGAWDLSPCKEGTPLVMSFPHFYRGAKEYLEQSVGLQPDQDKHEMVIVLEPTTAVSLKVAIRIQMNFAIKPTKYFKQLKNIPEMLHPIFWMDQGVTLPPETIQMMKDKLFKLPELVKTGSFFVAGLGVIIIAAAFVICWCRKSRGKNNKYKPEKGQLNKMNSFETAETSLGSPIKSDWSQLSPNEKYSKIASPPNQQKGTAPEEEALLSQNGTRSAPRSIPVQAPVIVYPKHNSPTTRTNSNPAVVSAYPKGHVDEVDEKRGLPSTTRSLHSLGSPFPTQNGFSSSNSVNNELLDIDNTLKGINDALSSYENLK